MKGNVDDGNAGVFTGLSKNPYGKPYGDMGYGSSALFESLFNDGIHLVTGIKSNMKKRLMSLRDKILPHKRSVVETGNDEPKNICRAEHSRHGSTINFPMNLLSTLATYCFLIKNRNSIRPGKIRRTIGYVPPKHN
jgi:hypothetical protein